ncbi:MAG: hypothetical protein FJ190_12145 [Gammaproteobacteria bacterium]|nr:hypothetical protein [Gammaproteobacteria bacterium]
MNTTQLTTKTYTDHQELSRLLPWFVNKSLQGDELKAVESHVNACLTCKREVIQLSKLAHAVKHEGMLDSAENASFARLKMRLHGQQPEADRHQQSAVSGNVVQLNASANHRINSRITNWYRPASAMAAAVLLSLTFMLPMTVDQNGYRTLSNGEIEKTIDVNEIRVVFAEGLDLQKKMQLSRVLTVRLSMFRLRKAYILSV